MRRMPLALVLLALPGCASIQWIADSPRATVERLHDLRIEHRTSNIPAEELIPFELSWRLTVEGSRSGNPIAVVDYVVEIDAGGRTGEGVFAGGTTPLEDAASGTFSHLSRIGEHETTIRLSVSGTTIDGRSFSSSIEYPHVQVFVP